MSKLEAQILARQIGAPVKTASALSAYCDANGIDIAIENSTGAWVLLRDGAEIARCA